MEEDFANPPTAVSPYVWWHWMGPNISKEGITKDLEAMKASNIGGATIFHLTSTDHEGKERGKRGIANLPFPDITFRSQKWWEMMTFAVSEAQRLGLELGMHNCPGYSATGGPWITPELSMQNVIFTKTQVKGGETFSGILPQPKAVLNFYRDIAVIAIPDTDPVDTKAVLDLSNQMDQDGKLTWKAAPGSWLIYRFGHTSTARAPCPIPDGLQALEVDKMSASASKFHFEQVINPLREHFGAAMGKTFRHLTFDSYEAGGQNWTPAFRDEFIKRKGYDPVRWLPLLDTKHAVIEKRSAEVPVCVLGTPEQSARFLWDFKDVIAQLYQQNNFEQGARMIQESGLQMQFEGYGGPFDPIAASATAHIPMGEFWTATPGDIGAYVVSSARAVDRRVVAAEALTGKPDNSKFSEDPACLKITGDGAYISGVNRLVLHHWVHQPFGDAFKPGVGMGWWGTHFGRNQTWAEPGKAYYRYLARSQSLLQRGQGIGAYLTLDFAVANADAIPRAALLRGDVRVDQGQIILPSGRRYPFLALPNAETMLPEVARKLKEIVSEGAVIVGQKPARSPGLSGFPRCDDEIQKLAAELWGDAEGRNKIENRVGKGKVFAGSVNQLLDKCKIAPAVTFVEQGPRKARATARQDGETEFFFISNTSDSFYEATPSFHVIGKQPEIWQAESGSYSAAPLWREVSGRTEVPLRLRGKESVFVIFRKPAPRGDHLVALQADPGAKMWNVEVNSKGIPVIASSSALSGVALWSSGNRVPFSLIPLQPLSVSGGWEVSFAPGMGAPDRTSFPDLKSWSEHSVPAIKYFSGTATYRKCIDIPAGFLSKSKRVILDLGAVSNLAVVKVNGIDFGVSWHAPFQFDITGALKPGQNKLEIFVTNTWANRLIGDEQEPEDMEWGPARTHFKDFTGRSLLAFPDWFVKGQPRPSQGRKTFTTWNYFKKDSPLLPAGLLGPVALRAMDEIQLAQ